jgi:hypothetical protein
VRRWIAIGAAVVAIAAALVVVGVGGSGTNPTVPSTAITDAVAATTKLSGFRIAMDGAIESKGARIPLTGSGVMSSRGRRGSFTMTMVGPESVGDLDMRLVFLGHDWYMRSALFDDKLPAGKSWARFDIRTAAREQGVDPNWVSMDPSRWLEQLRSVSGRVERLGRERVRGVPTTHYRAFIDLRRAVLRGSSGDRRQAERTADEMVDALGSSTLPEDVWIDAQRHIRRVGIDYEVHEGRFQLRQDLYDFGTPVRVEAPAEDDVADLTDLLGTQGQSGVGSE